MKKLRSMVAAVALTASSCGDTAEEPKVREDSGGRNAGGNNDVALPEEDAGLPAPFPMCDRERALDAFPSAGARWMMPKPWTEEALTDCTALCPDADLSCFEAMCDNGMLFVECFLSELGYCAADVEGAPCAATFVDIACCADAEQCTDAGQGAFDACIGNGGPCASYVDDYTECANRDERCQNESVAACVSSPSPADTDAGSESAAIARLAHMLATKGTGNLLGTRVLGGSGAGYHARKLDRR